MEITTFWFIMFAGGLLTYAIRLSFIILLGWVEVPDLLRRALRFVPPAVLSAIVVQELLFSTGSLNISLGNNRLLAGVIAALVAWRTRNALLVIVVGMIVLLVLQYFKPV